MNNRKVIILIVALLLAGFGIWLWLPRVDAKIIGKEATIRRVVFGSERTENAYLSLSYTADSRKYFYINIVIDFNKDGKFASYERDGKTQEEWAIQNMETKIFANEGGNYDFKLTDVNVDDQKDFPTKIILTKDPLENWQGKKLRQSGYQTTKIPSIEVDDFSTRFTLHPEGKTSAGFTENLFTPAFAQSEQIPNLPPQDSESDATKTGEAQGQTGQSKTKEKTIETLAKEFEVFNGDVPDITQGKNECAPTSIANSLLWLSKKNNFTDKIPKTQGELINELKGDLKWGVNKGVLDEDFIPGKEAFAKRHKISIETHRVNAKDYDINIVAKIAQELRKGQDVEIGIEYWKKQADGKWEVVGGHWMTAVGATGTKDSQTIFVHDPASPGPSLLDIYKVDGTRIIDYRYQGDAVAYIQYAVAESPVTPPPTVPPSDSSSPTNSTSTPVINTQGPTFKGKYETGTEGGYFYINLMVTPLDLAGKEFSGMEIDLGAQNPALPATNNCSVNVNLAGWGASDWQSSKSELVHRWFGSTLMQRDQKSIMTLYFSDSFTPPTDINMKILDKDGNPVDVSLTQE